MLRRIPGMARVTGMPSRFKRQPGTERTPLRWTGFRVSAAQRRGEASAAAQAWPGQICGANVQLDPMDTTGGASTEVRVDQNGRAVIDLHHQMCVSVVPRSPEGDAAIAVFQRGPTRPPQPPSQLPGPPWGGPR